MTGLALVVSELPVRRLAEVEDRVHQRGEQPEVRFEWWQEPALLPVRWDGSLKLIRWGSKLRRDRLPQGGSLTTDQIDGGMFGGLRLEEVTIPANYGFHRGTWFLIHEGVRGVLLPDLPGGPVVYLLMVPATNYYKNMTGQSPFMPVFVNQTI